MPTNITLTSKYVEDASGNKFAPITTPNAVRWPNGDDLDDKLAEKQAVIDSSNKLPASNVSGLATVATSGNYNDLSNQPTIPIVPTNVSAFTNDAEYITSTDIAGKEDKMSIAQQTGYPTTLSPAINTLTKVTMHSSLTVTLPTISTNTAKVQSLVLILTAASGYTPSLTITQTGSIIYFPPDFTIEANSSYEINCMWVGNNTWIVASHEIFYGGA